MSVPKPEPPTSTLRSRRISPAAIASHARAAAIVINCELPLTREHADAISNLTGESIEIESYADAGHAIRRWFATMDEASWTAKH
jgi:hypothetical protein